MELMFVIDYLHQLSSSESSPPAHGNHENLIRVMEADRKPF